MKTREVMTPYPTCCRPDATLDDVARLMVENNCGEIPICEEGRVVGVVTDRDIVCRVVACGKNPAEVEARGCMSSPAATIGEQEPLEKAIGIMQDLRIRRLPVVDSSEKIVGIVSLSDVAERIGEREVGQIVYEITHQLHRKEPSPVG
ncbi:MAG: CBS domain-containing protein [Thermoanaerobaculia bacterium]